MRRSVVNLRPSLWIGCVVWSAWASIAVAGVIPAARTVDWTGVGYPGGDVPRPTTIVDVKAYGAKGDGTTDDRAAIVAAIAALGGNPGVVNLPAGKYLMLSAIGLPSGVVLRGAGAGVTFVNCNPPNSGTGCFNIGGKTSGTYRDVSAGLSKGSTALTVSDATGFSVGDWAELRQNNGTWDTNPATWAAYAVGQMVKITAIDGNVLTIDRPLRIDYDAGLVPQIVRVLPVKDVGIEDLTLERVADPTPTAAGYNIGFSLAVQCWVRGVESNKSIGSHVMLTRSARIQVTGSYFHDAFTYDGTSTRGYGVTASDHTGECLIEGNIFKHLRHAMQIKVGANGNVFAYNDSHDPYRSETFNDFAGDISVHGHYAFANLFEGNTVANIIIDQYWGAAGPYNTFFRNRAEWYGIIITPDTNVTGNQNFVANEVVKGKSNTLLGFYYTLYYGILGTGHLQIANNVAGSLKPAGSGPVADVSYYRAADADFCEVAASWPSIGVPNTINTGANRARDRYLAGSTLTYDGLWLAVGAAVSIVEGDSTVLQGASDGGRAPATAKWTPATALDDPTLTGPTASPDTTTTYTYTRRDANNCTRSASTLVTVTGTVAPVVFAPPPGSYSGVQSVTATTPTPQAVVRYTVDGTEPIASSPIATGGIAVGAPLTLKARGFKVDFADSEVTTGDYDIDIDECAAGGACDLNADCTNTWGGFGCSCHLGFLGDGLPGGCENVDECSNGSATCDGNAWCEDTDGSYVCSCKPGYDGNGVSCVTACGDGIAAGDESCDDGNPTNDDLCANDCTVNPPGDACALALTLTPGIPLDVTLTGAHAADLSPCDVADPVGQADVFVQIPVQTGWQYVATATPLAGAQLAMALRQDCAQTTCLQPTAPAPSAGDLAQISWTAQQDATVIVQVILVQGQSGGVTLAVVGEPPPAIDEAPDAGSTPDTIFTDDTPSAEDSLAPDTVLTDDTPSADETASAEDSLAPDTQVTDAATTDSQPADPADASLTDASVPPDTAPGDASTAPDQSAAPDQATTPDQSSAADVLAGPDAPPADTVWSDAQVADVSVADAQLPDILADVQAQVDAGVADVAFVDLWVVDISMGEDVSENDADGDGLSLADLGGLYVDAEDGDGGDGADGTEDAGDGAADEQADDAAPDTPEGTDSWALGDATGDSGSAGSADGVADTGSAGDGLVGADGTWGDASATDHPVGVTSGCSAGPRGSPAPARATSGFGAAMAVVALLFARRRRGSA